MFNKDGNGTENQSPKRHRKTIQTKILTVFALFMPAYIEQTISKSDVSTHENENTFILKHDTNYPCLSTYYIF